MKKENLRRPGMRKKGFLCSYYYNFDNRWCVNLVSKYPLEWAFDGVKFEKTFFYEFF